MDGKRGRYSTRQQAAVISLMRARVGESLTTDEIHDALGEEGASVGRTTVYRSLGRLSSEGRVVQVPDPGGGPARWCLAEGATGGTCLVCLGCHRVFPLACEGFEAFVRHVSADHGFVVEPRRTVVYGYCESCAEGRRTTGARG